MINRIKRIINRPERLIIGIQLRLAHITGNQKMLIKALYRLMIGKNLNLSTPQTFTEKIQWLKLNDHNPLYHKMVDKYEVKKYVADIIGEEYIIPTIGVWDNFEDINFEELPNQFVIKSTNGGGGSGVIICHDKNTLNMISTKEKLEDSLKIDIYSIMGEWVYKDIPPRILVEQYMENAGKPLIDYKFFCFNGDPKFFFIAADRFNDNNEAPIFDFYDMNCDLLPFNNVGYRSSGVKHVKIERFEEMISIAKRLSQNIPFLRVDLYLINGKVYSGETTFYHDSGFYAFEPASYDYSLGKMLDISAVKKTI